MNITSKEPLQEAKRVMENGNSGAAQISLREYNSVIIAVARLSALFYPVGTNADKLTIWRPWYKTRVPNDKFCGVRIFLLHFD